MKRKYNLKSDNLKKVKREFVHSYFTVLLKIRTFSNSNFFLKYIPLEISEIQCKNKETNHIVLNNK